MTGLEPATTEFKIQCSDVELHSRLVLPPGVEPGTS